VLINQIILDLNLLWRTARLGFCMGSTTPKISKIAKLWQIRACFTKNMPPKNPGYYVSVPHTVIISQ